MVQARGATSVSVTTHQPDPWWYLQVLLCSKGGSDGALKSVPFTSNSASHSYLPATSVEARSLIKAECCPDLSPFLLKRCVLCSMRKSFAAWFNEPSVEPADLMTCENINLLPPRVLLLREAVYYSSKVLVEPFLTARPVCTHPLFILVFDASKVHELQTNTIARFTSKCRIKTTALLRAILCSFRSRQPICPDGRPVYYTRARPISPLLSTNLSGILLGGPWAEFTFDRRPKRTTALLECRREFSTWQLAGGSWSDVIRCEWSQPSSKYAANSVWVNPALLKNANVTLTAETWTTIYYDTNLQKLWTLLPQESSKIVCEHGQELHNLSLFF